MTNRQIWALVATDMNLGAYVGYQIVRQGKGVWWTMNAMYAGWLGMCYAFWAEGGRCAP